MTGEAAFAHFGRRFDDVSTEITLMEERLASGTSDARKIKANAAALAETLPTACLLGDVDELATRLANLLARVDVIVVADHSRRDERRATQTARKEALADEAEDLAAILNPLESRRQPATHDPRRMEDNQRPGPKGQRRVVEALFGGPRNLQAATGITFLRVRLGAYWHQAIQGTALLTGRKAVQDRKSVV